MCVVKRDIRHREAEESAALSPLLVEDVKEAKLDWVTDHQPLDRPANWLDNQSPYFSFIFFLSINSILLLLLIIINYIYIALNTNKFTF